jgi:hypothetical protein
MQDANRLPEEHSLQRQDLNAPPLFIVRLSHEPSIVAGIGRPGALNTVDLRRGDTVTRRRGDWESAAAPCSRVSPSPRLRLKSTALPGVLKPIHQTF